LVLLDAENDCPEQIARDFSVRVSALGVLFPVVIVVAKRMYETWLVASITTLAGRFGLPQGLTSPVDVEEIPNPKNWIDERLPHGRAYKETQDQEAMTVLMDLTLAGSSRSFRRLEHGIREALAAIDNGERLVTPEF
jgi:hypothetical protein